MAGSAYTYVRKAIDSRLGFIAGWAVLLDYLFLPMAIWLIGAAYLHSAFPAVPNAVWVLAFIGVTTTINIVGLRLAKNVNGLLMLVQFLVLGAFVALCVHYVLGDPGQAVMVTATVARWRPAGAAGDERCGDRLLLVPRVSTRSVP